MTGEILRQSVVLGDFQIFYFSWFFEFSRWDLGSGRVSNRQEIGWRFIWTNSQPGKWHMSPFSIISIFSDSFPRSPDFLVGGHGRGTKTMILVICPNTLGSLLQPPAALGLLKGWTHPLPNHHCRWGGISRGLRNAAADGGRAGSRIQESRVLRLVQAVFVHKSDHQSDRLR